MALRQTSKAAGRVASHAGAGIDLATAQIELFPVRAEIEFPNVTGTVEAWGRVIAVDGQGYIVKTDKDGLPGRASEWVATLLAEAAGIACPTPKVIELLNGTRAFGSREIANVADQTVTAELLTSPSTLEGLRGSPLTSILSPVYAYDMFINNVDRHDHNFVSIEDRGTRRIYPIDFGRSLFWVGPLVGFPTAGQNTRRTGAAIRKRHGFDIHAALGTLERLRGVSVDHIRSIFSMMPEEWLDTLARAEFIRWWASSERLQRIDALTQGLKDGSLL